MTPNTNELRELAAELAHKLFGDGIPLNERDIILSHLQKAVESVQEQQWAQLEQDHDSLREFRDYFENGTMPPAQRAIFRDVASITLALTEQLAQCQKERDEAREQLTNLTTEIKALPGLLISELCDYHLGWRNHKEAISYLFETIAAVLNKARALTKEKGEVTPG